MKDAKQPRRPQCKPGMIYAVPLADGSYGLAQAGEPTIPTVIGVALFLERVGALPCELPKLNSSRLISLTSTWRKNLDNGAWFPLGVAELTPALAQHPAQALASAGYVGAKHYDAGLLSEFLSACHGVLPWNVMHDPTYYEKLLLPGSGRPEKAVLLGEEERTAYRREVFGIGA